MPRPLQRNPPRTKNNSDIGNAPFSAVAGNGAFFIRVACTAYTEAKGCERLGVWETVEKKRRVLRHGGRAVLFLELELPCGGSALCQHARALSTALGEYAVGVLLPVAMSELEEAVVTARGYAFFPHRYAVSFQTAQVYGGVRVTLCATHERGREICSFRTLVMHWSADGALQMKQRGGRKCVTCAYFIRSGA